MDTYDLDGQIAELETWITKMSADIEMRTIERDKSKGRLEFLMALKREGFVISKTVASEPVSQV